MYKGVPFWKYISFILQNSDMPPNIPFVNNRSLVNYVALLWTEAGQPWATYVHWKAVDS